MQLVEQHCIGRGDSRYEVIDCAAFASKNLYNAALYEMRQAYIHYGHRISYSELYHLMKSHEAYMGKRVKRGLFRSASGKQYNADVNGAYNIIRKVAPDAFGKGVEDAVVHPLPLQV